MARCRIEKASEIIGFRLYEGAQNDSDVTARRDTCERESVNADGLKRTRVVGTIHRNVWDSIRGITVKTPQGERAADWALPPAPVRKINRILLRANPGPFIRGSANTLSFVRNGELMMIATRLKPNESHARPPSHRHPAAAPSRPPYAAPLVYFNAIINRRRGYIVLPAFSPQSLKRVSIFPHALGTERARNARAFVRRPNAWSDRSSNNGSACFDGAINS